MSLAANLSHAVSLTPQVLEASWKARATKQLQQAQNINVARMAAWLSVAPEQIAAVQWENVHAGTTSRSRLLVDYRDDSLDLPRRFFVKTTAATYSTRVFGNLFGLGRNEVNFYRSIRPRLAIPAPRVFHVGGNDEDFLLLLEDLAASGCEFADITTRCDFERARSVVKTLASLHAQFWQSPLFDKELAWVNRRETDRHAKLMTVLRGQVIPMAIKKYREVVPREVLDALPLIMESYPQLEREWSRGERTLVHGDAHIGNMYFNKGVAGLLDWQMPNLCQGMRDVSYFLVNSVPSGVRRENQEALIKIYLATLADAGIQLEFDEAWYQYRLHTTYTWISSVVTAAGSHMQAPKIAAAGLSRTCKAMVDLNVIELLPDLRP